VSFTVFPRERSSEQATEVISHVFCAMLPTIIVVHGAVRVRIISGTEKSGTAGRLCGLRTKQAKADKQTSNNAVHTEL